MMQVGIRDRDALLEISPAALSAYARNAGWSLHKPYREHSDIYTGDTVPEILVPRTTRLGDYASSVAALIETFAEVAEQEELTVYRSLVVADRDVIRVRAAENDDGSLSLNDGVDLVGGARDMVLAAACSLHDPRPVYRAGANREAVELLRQMRLGQTEHGSFVVTLLTPVVPPPIPMLIEDPDDHNAPISRRMTKRLIGALAAIRAAAEQVVVGDSDTFSGTVTDGVSANLCEALVKIIKPFSTLDIGVLWAQTRPVTTQNTVVRFGQADSALLGEVARSLRERAPKPDELLHGFVRILKRDGEELDGTIKLKTEIDGQQQSVEAVLEQADYETALQAHRDRAPVELKGDLERTGQRWRLLNARVKRVLRDDEQELGDG
ncbi:MAG: hypothetical protein OXE81_03585 [Gammaproteobacteria bacterium]|nr:hypothetical protein [Gammaproteobacteria bacterium]